ncbi:MAG: diaminopimelate epimerase [Verrucomicrobiaceae bacterium]|nr:diaminopimelate epimerase [Verrucomicrobiaceae bacterium]
MLLRFTKMHGCGNDFVVLDLISQRFILKERHIRKLADRHFGIGCDQVLVVEAPGRPDVDFRYRIFNADGGEVEQCGNGARCFARFVRDNRLTGKDVLRVETKGGVIELQIARNKSVRVNMGTPVLNPNEIPFRAAAQAVTYALRVDAQTFDIGAVSMGNPHAVLLVDDVHTAPVALLGPKIETHADFPQRVNAGFMQVVSQQEINLRVFERGAGETLACGTGACAAMVAGVRLGLLDTRVDVETRGGLLTIEWAGGDASVLMTGPATTVFEGDIDVPAQD